MANTGNVVQSREWHLTPEGWVKGTRISPLQGDEYLPTPTNRVKTCKATEAWLAGGGLIADSMEVEWESTDSEEVNNLSSKYGGSPEAIELI